MDAAVKQEPRDPVFDSNTYTSPDQWKMYASWVATTSPMFPERGPEQQTTPYTTLVIPKRSSLKEECLDVKSTDTEKTSPGRSKRVFINSEQKDTSYWTKRVKNNDSARRSRLKKKAMEKVMECKLTQLQKENIELKYELAALKRHFADRLGPDEDSSESSQYTLTMRRGSASDTSDTSSIQSEQDFHQTLKDRGAATSSPAPEVTSSIYNLGTPSATIVPTMSVRYQLMQGSAYSGIYSYPYADYKNHARQDEGVNLETSSTGEQEAMTKIPHKFRLKRDFHSAFYVQPDINPDF